MVKECGNCIHKNVCGLKEKYAQYKTEMTTMQEKYPEMGFKLDCPSWRFENEVEVNKCLTCKYKKQAENDMWMPLIRDGERVNRLKDRPKYNCVPSTPAKKIEDIKKEEEEKKTNKIKFDYENNLTDNDIQDFINELVRMGLV